jgi:2-hydroxychromene-2-carboxylate isomerase
MSAHTIAFYFDYNSPYSYIASHRIEAICEHHGAALLWRPMVLGSVFQANGIEPPHIKPNRRAYMLQDLKDLTARYGIPYKERTEFLFHPILSLRVTLAAPEGRERSKAVHALFRGAFAEDLDLGKMDVVARLLDQGGLDGHALVERAQSQPIKDQLRTATDQAIAHGIFGAPTLLVDERKMFWGHDRLPLLESYLQSS